jgi:hypothetical protein
MGTNAANRTSFWRRWGPMLVAFGLIGTGGTLWILDGEPTPAASPPNPVVSRTVPPVVVIPDGAPVLTRKPAAVRSPRASRATSTKPFVPTAVAVSQVGARAVQSLGRIQVGENGFSLPDPEGLNSQVYAWDREGAQPGSGRGAVNLTAHTYPPGQDALGNQLFDQLEVGDIVDVRGTQQSLKYRVEERVEVSVADYPSARVLDEVGAPYLTITICSGERRGPGDWTMRTVWFATPLK